MRKEHKPYYLKRLQILWHQWWTQYFIAPQFDELGTHTQILNPRTLEIFGHHIKAGNYLHIISNKQHPVRLTTWSGKGMEGHITIGDYCLISPGTTITSAQHINIGNNCMFAADCYISDSDWHGLYNRTRPFRCTRAITIGDNVWIGHGAKIGKGVCIGENSVVAAGAVVVKDVPENTVVGGNPATTIKRLDPKRRMLKREILFKDSDHYFYIQDQLNRWALSENTTRQWLKACFFPRKSD